MSDPVARKTTRQRIFGDGSVRYEVTYEIISAGDMPFKHLFVLRISDTADAKDDVLARVATPADIRQADPSSPIYVKVVETEITRIGGSPFARIANVNDITALPRDRVVAVAQNRTEYLSTAVSLTFDNITTADAADRQLRDRLSALIVEWRTFNTDFITNPYVDYDLPQLDSSVEATRTAAYVAARDARVLLEADRDRAAKEHEACETGCASDKAIYDFLVEDVAKLSAARTKVVGIADTGPVKDFVLAQGAYVSDPDSYQQLLITRQQELSDYATKVRACAKECDALAATLLTAQRAVNDARAAENDALAAVVEVCPTFDPTTV